MVTGRPLSLVLRNGLGTWHIANTFRVKMLKKLSHGCNKKRLHKREAAPGGDSLEGAASLDPEFPASDSQGAALLPWDLPQSRAGSGFRALVLCLPGMHTCLLVLPPRASPFHLSYHSLTIPHFSPQSQTLSCPDSRLSPSPLAPSLHCLHLLGLWAL